MFYFKRNLSVIERLVRIALGICTAMAVLAPTLWSQVAAYAIAATLAGTAIVGFCPAYALFGRKTQ